MNNKAIRLILGGRLLRRKRMMNTGQHYQYSVRFRDVVREQSKRLQVYKCYANRLLILFVRLLGISKPHGWHLFNVTKSRIEDPFRSCTDGIQLCHFCRAFLYWLWINLQDFIWFQDTIEEVCNNGLRVFNSSSNSVQSPVYLSENVTSGEKSFQWRFLRSDFSAPWSRSRISLVSRCLKLFMWSIGWVTCTSRSFSCIISCQFLSSNLLGGSLSAMKCIWVKKLNIHTEMFNTFLEIINIKWLL